MDNRNDQEALVPELDDDALQAMYARTSYLLRESRKTLLKRHDVAAEAELLERIRLGQADAESAYGDYLSALILEQMRAQIRAELGALLHGGAALEAAGVSLHLHLKEQLEQHYAARMAEPARLAQDALLLAFDTGLLMEVRYASADEYALAWSWGDAELRIDTAPAGAGRPTPAHRLRDADGVQRVDTLTSPGSDCWANFSGLLEVLLRDPLLGGTAA
ncbi:hypothetical protein [Janthinobacterium fluminis]|uniref:Chorismate mutase n=1 Tax=Janthinobacterium fluminis TaxID=2987524 RepID=A0ABT5K2G0_9BURK|nr:hypothetical protein [Janthinobacterium fluminis]MDC8759168.1 hypothetical protein [Janthinobacterium fluminis]